MTGETARIFCQSVILCIQKNEWDAPSMSLLGACWLYNKIRNRIHQKKITLKIPFEYSVMLKWFFMDQPPVDVLQHTVYYSIHEQIDRQLPKQLLIK